MQAAVVIPILSSTTWCLTVGPSTATCSSLPRRQLPGESMQLPVGKRISEGGSSPPRLWATSDPVPDAGRVWQALAGLHPDTGLVPILLAFLDLWRH
jgi:hypothetical protein